jgi:hypothetical protein
MANMDLSLGWRMLYALDVLRSGIIGAEYNTIRFNGQNSPGSPTRWQDGTFELMNDPTCGVAGPGLGMNAVEFNAGTRIQRGWDRTGQTFITAPNGFNMIAWFETPTLHEGMIFTVGGNKLHSGVAVASEGSNLTYYDAYPSLKIALTRLDYLGNDIGYWSIALESRSPVNGGINFFRQSSAMMPIEANRWYCLVITTNRNLISEHSFMYLNAVDAWGTTDWSGMPALATGSYLSICIADLNQYTGINGGTEGQGRFVGRLAGVAINFAKCVNTTEGTDGYMPEDRIRRQYWRGATFGSPIMRPAPTPLRALPFAGASTLANRWSGGMR